MLIIRANFETGAPDARIGKEKWTKRNHHRDGGRMARMDGEELIPKQWGRRAGGHDPSKCPLLLSDLYQCFPWRP